MKKSFFSKLLAVAAMASLLIAAGCSADSSGDGSPSSEPDTAGSTVKVSSVSISGSSKIGENGGSYTAVANGENLDGATVTLTLKNTASSSQLGYNNVKFQYITNLDYPDDNDVDAYVVTNRSDTVLSSVTAVSGGSTYNNFDTSEDLHLADGSLTEPKPKDALSNVVKFAGRHNPDFAWTFDNAEQDSNYSLIKELKAAVVAYDNAGLSKIGQ